MNNYANSASGTRAPSVVQKRASKAELDKVVDFLAARSVRGQEKRAALPGEDAAHNWATKNVYKPLAANTALNMSPDQQLMATRGLGGAALGLLGGGTLGLVSALRTPKRKRSLLHNVLTGSLLGAGAGAAGGLGYHGIAGTPTAPAAGGAKQTQSEDPGVILNTVHNVVNGYRTALDGNSNIGSKGLGENLARMASQPPAPDVIAKYLDTPQYQLPLDPQKVREVVKAGPAAIKQLADTMMTQRGEFIDKRTGNQVPFTKDNIHILTDALNQIPMEGGITADVLNNLPTSGNALLDATGTLAAVDAAGRYWTSKRPWSGDQASGLKAVSGNEVVTPSGKLPLGESADNAAILRQAANAGPTALKQTINAPTTEAQRVLSDAESGLNAAVLRAQRRKIPLNESFPVFAGQRAAQRRQAGLTAAAEHVKELQETARAAGRAWSKGTGGGGFAGSRFLRGWKGVLPYILPTGAYVAFDKPYENMNYSPAQLYVPDFAANAARRGIIPQGAP